MNQNISKILKKYSISPSQISYYGDSCAKIQPQFIKSKKPSNKKLIVVTSINPTPMGEGKTTIAIGLSDCLNKTSKTILCLRQPSIGPTLGLKGGATGRGKSTVNPEELINYGLTGDFFTIETIHNLIASIIDNHIYQGNELKIDPKKIIWRRVIDLSDRSLRNITIPIDAKKNISYQGGFDITVTSEIMAILCLAKNEDDFVERINNIIVAYDTKNKPIYVKDLKLSKTIRKLSKNLLCPNALATNENTLCLMHGGPFANIAHGCSSLISINTAFKYAKNIITECGFGSDLGFEKFMNIVSPQYDKPDAVIVCISLKAILYHGTTTDNKNDWKDQLHLGLENLKQHVKSINNFGINPIIAINYFKNDNPAQLKALEKQLKALKYKFCLCSPVVDGYKSFAKLASLIRREHINSNKVKPLYRPNQPLSEKINTIVRQVYGLNTQIVYEPKAKAKIAMCNKYPYYICMAKTPLSLSSDPKNLIYNPYDKIVIRDFVLAHGAQFIIPICQGIYRMPGLPKKPNAQD